MLGYLPAFGAVPVLSAPMELLVVAFPALLRWEWPRAVQMGGSDIFL